VSPSCRTGSTKGPPQALAPVRGTQGGTTRRAGTHVGCRNRSFHRLGPHTSGCLLAWRGRDRGGGGARKLGLGVKARSLGTGAIGAHPCGGQAKHG
jgi:hypothetical protein